MIPCPKPLKTKHSRYIRNKRPPEGTSCWFCTRQDSLVYHEVYPGSANRRVSQLNEFQVPVCPTHHDELQLYKSKKAYRLKQDTQRDYEVLHGHEAFMKLIRKNYL